MFTIVSALRVAPPQGASQPCAAHRRDPIGRFLHKSAQAGAINPIVTVTRHIGFCNYLCVCTAGGGMMHVALNVTTVHCTRGKDCWFLKSTEIFVVNGNFERQLIPSNFSPPKFSRLNYPWTLQIASRSKQAFILTNEISLKAPAQHW